MIQDGWQFAKDSKNVWRTCFAYYRRKRLENKIEERAEESDAAAVCGGKDLCWHYILYILKCELLVKGPNEKIPIGDCRRFLSFNGPQRSPTVPQRHYADYILEAINQAWKMKYIRHLIYRGVF